jgi:hypothetical protein
VIQSDDDKEQVPPKADAKQIDKWYYIPKSTITAFDNLIQEIKPGYPCHIISSSLSSVMDMCRKNGMKEMFCPCLLVQQQKNSFCYPSNRKMIKGLKRTGKTSR